MFGNDSSRNTYQPLRETSDPPRHSWMCRGRSNCAASSSVLPNTKKEQIERPTT